MPAVRKDNQNMREYLQPDEAYENPPTNVSQTSHTMYILSKRLFTAM